MIIEVFGTPVAQPRHKVTIRGNHPHAYIPDSHKIHAWKALIQGKCAECVPGRKYDSDDCPHPIIPPEGAVSVKLTFTLPRPKSLPKKVIHHIKKPDIDNLAKAVLDCCSGILYKDDSQVVELHAEKRYGKDVGVKIEIGD